MPPQKDPTPPFSTAPGRIETAVLWPPVPSRDTHRSRMGSAGLGGVSVSPGMVGPCVGCSQGLVEANLMSRKLGQPLLHERNSRK